MPFAMQFSFLLKRQSVASQVSGTLRVLMAFNSSATSKMLPFSIIIFSLISSFLKVSHSAVSLHMFTDLARQELPVLWVQSPLRHRISMRHNSPLTNLCKSIKLFT